MAGGHNVDAFQHFRIDDPFAHAYVWLIGLRVLLGKRIRKVRIDEHSPAVPLQQIAALSEPPEAKSRCFEKGIHFPDELLVLFQRRYQAHSVARMIRAPLTMFLSFSRAAQRAVWLSPQSGASDSRSAGTYFRHFLIRWMTSS